MPIQYHDIIIECVCDLKFSTKQFLEDLRAQFIFLYLTMCFFVFNHVLFLNHGRLSDAYNML